MIKKYYFLNFGTVFLTAVRMMKLGKAHCSPPLVDEDNSMILLLTPCHFQPLVTFCHSWLEMAPRERQKPFHSLHTSNGKQILIAIFPSTILNNI